MTTTILTQIGFDEIKEGDLVYSSGQVGYFSSLEDLDKYAERLQMRRFEEYKQKERFRRTLPLTADRFIDVRAGIKTIQSKTPIFIVKKTQYHCESIQDEKIAYIPNEELKQYYLIRME